MIAAEDFDLSDSDTSIIEKPLFPVSILKHLPAPRALLYPQHKTYELYSPRCLYAEPLTRTNPYAMPKAEEM